jgi:hypothetical protein
MRQVYAHEAVVVLPEGTDTQAIAAVVGKALPASHTSAVDLGGEVRIRILFAADPVRADAVRDRIDTLIEAGTVTGPDGTTTRWRPIRAGCVRVAPGDRDHARRLLQAPRSTAPSQAPRSTAPSQAPRSTAP